MIWKFLQLIYPTFCCYGYRAFQNAAISGGHRASRVVTATVPGCPSHLHDNQSGVTGHHHDNQHTDTGGT